MYTLYKVLKTLQYNYGKVLSIKNQNINLEINKYGRMAIVDIIFICLRPSDVPHVTPGTKRYQILIFKACGSLASVMNLILVMLISVPVEKILK